MGIFGGYRGSSFYKCVLANNAEIVAVCDFNEKYANKAKEKLGGDVAVYTPVMNPLSCPAGIGAVLEKYYRENGGIIEAVGKKNCGHHPHGLDDNTPIVEFIEKHSI